MKDQLEIIGKRLLKNLRFIAVGFFAVLLGASYFLYAREQNFPQPAADPPAPKPIESKFPNDNYNVVVSSFAAQKKNIEDDPRISRLIRVNMFDDKSVASEAEMEAAVREDYVKAQEAFTAGKLDDAMRLVESILQRNPTHRGSTEIKRKIEERRKAEADAAAAAAAAAGTAGAAPAEGQPVQ